MKFAAGASILLILAVLGSTVIDAQAGLPRELYFVGDGSTTVVTQPDGSGVFGMSAEGHGNADSLWMGHGSWNPDTDELPYGPTFIYDGSAGPMTITGPVHAYMWLESRAAPVCGVAIGQLFDLEGNILGPAGGIRVDDETPYADSPEEFLFEFDIGQRVIPGIKFQVATYYSDCGTPGVEFYWGSDNHPSRLELTKGYIGEVTEEEETPDEDTGPTIHTESLEDAVASIDLSFEDATQDTYQFTWTQGIENATLTYDVLPSAGEAMFSIKDAAETGVFEGTFGGATNGTEEFVGLTAGSWSIEITFTDYVGEFDLTIEPTPASEDAPVDGGEAPDEDQTVDSHDEGDSDAGASEGTSKKSPGVGALALLGLLGLAALRRRS